MNTPAHLLVSAAALGKGASRRGLAFILAGALLPDLPMFLFYLWQRLVLDAPERLIWGQRYFEAGWQSFFDLFNSAPLALAGLAAGWLLASRDLRLFFSAMLLHFAMDLPLHHDDGHAHLFPFSSWKFASAVSYWDPRHLGGLGAGIELAVVLASAAVLIRRARHRVSRVALAGYALVQTAAYFALSGLRLIPLS